VDLLNRFAELSRALSVAIVLPFAERIDAGTMYNSLTVFDSNGKARGLYRKIHVPNSEGYREDLHFKPGDLGYVVAPVGKTKLGLAICWDQWFPEVSRTLALKGAQLIVYPSAIGSEVAVPEFDSRPSWELVMRAQAVMNRVFVAAVNRVGQEEMIRFYGSSFVSDVWGNVLRRASRTRPEVVYADLDLAQIREANKFFGFFDARRPETYGTILQEVDSQGRLSSRRGRR